jgi:uncharacterized protein
MIDLEKRGIRFVSGPFLTEDHEMPGYGMTTLRIASQVGTETIAQNDPLYKSGICTYEVKVWQLNEGSFTITMNYSDKSYSIIL